LFVVRHMSRTIQAVEKIFLRMSITLSSRDLLK